MTPSNVVKAIFYPVTESRVLIPLIVFWLLMSFAQWGGALGYFLAFLVLPALFRYQMVVLEARARGVTPDTPDVDSFNWWGNLWTLYPLLLLILIVILAQRGLESFGYVGSTTVLVIAAAFTPASLAVLAITHSVAQSIHPIAIGRLLKACGQTFWIASAYLAVVVVLQIQTEWLPILLSNLAQILLTFSFFSLVGSLIEPYELIADISIPESPQPSSDVEDRQLEDSRVGVLTHAYALISRSNRSGGFDHIRQWMQQDPKPQAAWIWFFERMMQWQDDQHALFFAQHAVKDMLDHEESLPALKLVMRCRLSNEQFKPFPDDVIRIIDIAEKTGNFELVTALKGLS